jgi:dynein heavy chain
VVPPKVFSDFAAFPGAPPRPLLVERKRREYAANIDTLPALVWGAAAKGTLGGESLLELEHFDDDEFDVRAPTEWVALGAAAGSPGGGCRLPAVALCRAKYPSTAEAMAFEAVEVTGYDPSTQRFTVARFAVPPKPANDKEQAAADEAGLLFGATLLLHRLFVCFTVEDPLRFAARVAAAHASRYRAELTLRCQLYADCMPTEGLWDLEQDELSARRVLALATASSPAGKKLPAPGDPTGGASASAASGASGGGEGDSGSAMSRRSPEEELEYRAGCAASVLKEASEDYARCMAAVVLRVNGGKHVPGFQELVDFGGSSVLGCAPPPPRRPDLRDLPPYNLAKKCAAFDLATSLNIPEANDALQQAAKCVHDTCRHRSFFLSREPKRSQTLSEFQDAQERQMDDETASLRQWPYEMTELIRQALKPVTKGWFNVNETRIEAYLAGPLRRQLKATGFMMQVELTGYIARCASELEATVCAACPGATAVRSKNDVELLLHPGYLAYVSETAADKAKAAKGSGAKAALHEEGGDDEEELEDDDAGDPHHCRGAKEATVRAAADTASLKRQNALLVLDRAPPMFALKLKVSSAKLPPGPEGASGGSGGLSDDDQGATSSRGGNCVESELPPQQVSVAVVILMDTFSQRANMMRKYTFVF